MFPLGGVTSVIDGEGKLKVMVKKVSGSEE